MSSYEGNREDNAKKEMEDWSSEGEYQGSEDNYWRSDLDWNGGSSMAGEASGVSEATEEEQPEEEEEEEKEKKTKQKKINENERKPKKKFNMDDVGTDDDTTVRSDKMFKSNVSEMTDMSDIEDQISEAHSKFAEDKQSLSSVIGLVDEVTIKGETLARKASETSIALDKEKCKKGGLVVNNLSELSYDLDVLQAFGSSQKGRSSIMEKDSSGKIEYIESDQEEPSIDAKSQLDSNFDSKIEQDDDNLHQVSSKQGCVESRSLDTSVIEDSGSTHSMKCGGDFLDGDTDLEKDASDKRDASDHSCHEGHSCKDGNGSEIDNTSVLSQTCENCSKEDSLNDGLVQKGKDQSETSLKDDDSGSSRSSPVYDEPECCRNERHKHMCCFINIGAGGDDGGREAEIINRLKKLRDDITSMREELSHARKECKKESEEVAKLIEETIARNKAAEQREEIVTIQIPSLATPPKTPPTPAFTTYTLEELKPQQEPFPLQPLASKTQVPIPTAVLEERLRATRQTASTSYRASLEQLERMVEKEMASIQDSMTRLEPLNKMAAEWDHLQQVRSRSMTFMRDYRMEMVTAEMRLRSEKNLQNQSIETK